jgi:DNA polymerase-1
MDKIYLIDGSSMLSTHYFGHIPPAYFFAKTNEDKEKVMRDQATQTTDGIITNAVFGMTREIIKIIKEQKPQYLAVCWDVSRTTFRREIYPEYKAHREETVNSLSSQFKLMQEVLEHMGVPSFKLNGFEADDLIGTIATEMSKENEVIILTKDQDALQLINKNTIVWLNNKKAAEMLEETKEIETEKRISPKKYFPFTEKTFEHFYKLKPKQIIDFKALSGDKSDGIPGVPGFGPVGITPLLNHFGTVEDTFNYILVEDKKTITETFKNAKIKRISTDKLLEYQEQILMSKKLATIDCYIEEYKNKDKEQYRVNINKDKTIEIFKKLEFQSLLKK